MIYCAFQSQAESTHCTDVDRHEFSAGRQISGFSGLTEVLQARGLGNIARAASSEENGVLEFAKNDNRRLLHVVYRVGDLDKTIKYSALFSPSLPN